MLRRLKLLFIALALAGGVTPLLVPSPVYAIDPFEKSCASDAAKSSPLCKTTGEDPIGGKNGILYKVSRILSMVAGIGAVIVLIIGGFMHVTAGGDSTKVSNARRAIIGALVGLAVIALAQVFIALVINLVE